ncbi:hypothetical protein BL250_09180 [Erwinia sp. OLTSP20]|uniref:reverse transcriptase domain-containing protein n=1 Tax=unclassified Erwinia TaxID=2622719 RepID=UPI000C177B69|nr:MULTISPECIES: reverse transcriptase domain-containing protein [unclassified Erwinia]PIJ50703.1 hypothetical protein BV501_06855 [Erwinia sp. OAMSP11]PIJ75373.1 hypothetical protein BK416_01655 [Erwinia sp. OLSSP12]PIJ81871.1 hypothetical protein BLD47_07205 [Erwinia sp. OLCASP19]PIJ84526.1 hypothetical protein BLD46_07295 [Erwinia sp. OLMTSP26]PIJ86873.1 hypothetical protein BLD49_07065 [Erwinia sp. OLMDSP33]
MDDPVLLARVNQYLHYSVEDGNGFYTPEKGIRRGCALSPLLAGFCLRGMDTYFEAQPHLRYVRYRDDIVILTRTRWSLRRAVRALNVFLHQGDTVSIHRRPLPEERRRDLTGWEQGSTGQA